MNGNILLIAVAVLIFPGCKQRPSDDLDSDSSLQASELSQKYGFKARQPDSESLRQAHEILEPVKAFGLIDHALTAAGPFLSVRLNYFSIGDRLLSNLPSVSNLDPEDLAQDITVKRTFRGLIKEIRVDSKFIIGESEVGHGIFHRKRAAYEHNRLTYGFDNQKLVSIQYDLWNWQGGKIIWFHKFQAIFQPDGAAETWEPGMGRRPLQLQKRP